MPARTGGWLAGAGARSAVAGSDLAGTPGPAAPGYLAAVGSGLADAGVRDLTARLLSLEQPLPRSPPPCRPRPAPRRYSTARFPVPGCSASLRRSSQDRGGCHSPLFTRCAVAWPAPVQYRRQWSRGVARTWWAVGLGLPLRRAASASDSTQSR